MLRNSDGTAVDPVPFVVVTGMAFLGCYSFFPVYFVTLGLSAPIALVVTTGLFAALAVVAYSRLVWRARPEVRQEVSADLRLQTIFYYALAVTAVFLVLTLVAQAR